MNKKNRRVFCNVLQTLIVVAAAAVLVSNYVFPILNIHGSSMTPSLYDGDVVVCLKNADCETGDTIAFYYNNKILVKRVIARAGEWVNIDESGNVYINDKMLEEPYVEELALGECDIELPYQVPDGKVFVMGDHRSVSVDSRNINVGCVAEEQIVGKLILRIWPMNYFGRIP